MGRWCGSCTPGLSRRPGQSCQRGAVQSSAPTVTALRAVVERVQRYRASTFGPASEEPYRRRTSDWLRVVVASALLLVAARHAGGVTVTEQAIFDFFNSAPGWLLPVFRTVYRLGALWAVGLVVSAAVVGRRWRLARDLVLAGGLAWVVGRLLGHIVVEGTALEFGLKAVTSAGRVAGLPGRAPRRARRRRPRRAPVRDAPDPAGRRRARGRDRARPDDSRVGVPKRRVRRAGARLGDRGVRPPRVRQPRRTADLGTGAPVAARARDRRRERPAHADASLPGSH